MVSRISHNSCVSHVLVNAKDDVLKNNLKLNLILFERLSKRIMCVSVCENISANDRG